MRAPDEMPTMEEWAEYLEKMDNGELKRESWEPFWPTVVNLETDGCAYASIGGYIIRLAECQTGEPSTDSGALNFRPSGWKWK